MPQYLLVYVRLLQSVDILTQIVIPTEVRDLAVLALQENMSKRARSRVAL